MNFIYRSLIPVSSDDFITNINDYIMRNINTNITLKELAEVIHLHPNYFTQYFKKHFSNSPIVHVNLMKLDKAAQLLIDDSDKSIAEVAEVVGFNDYRYFGRLFKKRYGISPSAYKGIHYRS